MQTKTTVNNFVEYFILSSGKISYVDVIIFNRIIAKDKLVIKTSARLLEDIITKYRCKFNKMLKMFYKGVYYSNIDLRGQFQVWNIPGIISPRDES